MHQNEHTPKDQASGLIRTYTACWKIYQRGILYATVISLVYGLLHIFSMSALLTDGLKATGLTSFYIHFLPEATVSLSGIAILLTGALRYKIGNDEETVAAKHGFYLSAAKLFVMLAFVGYALTLPFSDRWIYDGVPQNYLVLLFETLGVIYLYYALKKQDIFFNYSFIQENSRKYYKRVLWNVLCITLALLGVFALTSVLDVALHGSFKHFFAIWPAYLLTTAGLTLEYLFISWTEKLSFDEKEHHGLHKGTFVKYLFLLINAYIGFTVLMLEIATGFGVLGDWLMSKGYHLAEVVTSLSSLHRHFTHESTVLLAMVLCKLGCQIRTCRAARKAITGIVILTSCSFGWEYITTFLLPHISNAGVEVFTLYVEIEGYIAILFSAVSALLWTVMIRDLVRTEKLSPRLWIVAGMRWFPVPMALLTTFVGTSNVLLFEQIVGGLLAALSLLLFLILLHNHTYEHEHEEYV